MGYVSPSMTRFPRKTPVATSNSGEKKLSLGSSQINFIGSSCKRLKEISVKKKMALKHLISTTPVLINNFIYLFLQVNIDLIRTSVGIKFLIQKESQSSFFYSLATQRPKEHCNIQVQYHLKLCVAGKMIFEQEIAFFSSSNVILKTLSYRLYRHSFGSMKDQVPE